MKDRRIKGNGTSSFVKMAMDGITTFEQFLAAAKAGTLTADITANNASTAIDEEGTPLTKANLMSPTAAAAFNLEDDTATPSLAFESLALDQDTIDAFSAIGIDLTGGV